MSKLFFIIIMLFAFSGTASAELNKSIAPEQIENSQKEESAKAKNKKQHKKTAQLRSKLTMLLVLGNAVKNSQAKPYVSQN